MRSRYFFIPDTTSRCGNIAYIYRYQWPGNTLCGGAPNRWWSHLLLLNSTCNYLDSCRGSKGASWKFTPLWGGRCLLSGWPQRYLHSSLRSGGQWRFLGGWITQWSHYYWGIGRHNQTTLEDDSRGIYIQPRTHNINGALTYYLRLAGDINWDFSMWGYWGSGLGWVGIWKEWNWRVSIWLEGR